MKTTISAEKAELHTTCLYFVFLVHQLLDIEDNDLKLNVLFFQQDGQHLVCFICYVDVNSEVDLVRRLPEIKLQNHEIQSVNTNTATV